MANDTYSYSDGVILSETKDLAKSVAEFLREMLHDVQHDTRHLGELPYYYDL